MMSWLAENLASKGYVVAGIHHRDPPITDATKFFGPLVRRPLDIAFVAQELRRRASLAPSGVESLIDSQRVALIGYSMGGYGVLTVAGSGLAPDGVAGAVPGDLIAPYVRDGAREADLRVPGLKAVVALSPAGGGHGFSAWGAKGLERLQTPALLIVGDKDETVGYADGVRPIFDQAIHAPRYLLVFHNAGHSIGVDPAPQAMRHRLWDLDWFEDPVWRKDRVIAINLHMITAFLDLYVRDNVSRSDYLRPSVAQSNDGVWPPRPTEAYDAFSPGPPYTTVWKGFQRRHVAGLDLIYAAPATTP
jgi:alpha-beta hydrolase superfamily lysophospholipase